MTVSLFSKQVGFGEPEIAFDITRGAWALAGGVAAASVVAGVAFQREDGSVLVQLVLGYGGTMLVLIFAGIAACVFGCPCCALAKRRAAAGARLAAATPLGGAVAAALTKSLVRRHRVGGGGDGDGASGGPLPGEPDGGAALSVVSATAQQQRAACT